MSIHDDGELSSKAEEGDAASMVRLAFRCHKDGDRQEAIRWCERALAGGYEEAAVMLGSLYVGLNNERAEELFERAANNGEAVGWYYLGKMAEKDRMRTKKTSAEIKKYFERGAVGGDPYSMNELGFIYQSNGDVDMAAQYYERATEQAPTVKLETISPAENGVRALVALYRGHDEEKFEYWLSRLAANGSTSAMSEYGYRISKKDPEAARMWITRSAEGGDPYGMMNLAALLWKTDRTEGRMWFKRSLEILGPWKWVKENIRRRLSKSG